MPEATPELRAGAIAAMLSQARHFERTGDSEHAQEIMDQVEVAKLKIALDMIASVDRLSMVIELAQEEVS